MNHPIQILQTKLQIPNLTDRCLPRARLTERLNQGLSLPLTLLSAPAGYGKTTLLVDWIQKESTGVLNGYRIAWLSLDEYDNDPERFLSYLIATLHQVDKNIGATALKMITMLHKAPLEDLLVSILNDVQNQPFRMLVVVDDYHQAHDPRIHRQVAYLLNSLPSNLHVILSTREDPIEFLPRLRARGQVNEIRAADLRFTSEEVVEFLKNRMGLDLSPEEIAVLENRTEGWIAALQLAASALKRRSDTSIIQGFTGTHPLILDYLLEEIFNQLDEADRQFLLQTSILERMTADLCNTLTHTTGAGLVLERLIRANLLIEPLDSTHTWFRYHRIFSSFLRSRLECTLPDTLPDLHRRAAGWHAVNGFANEAIYHALMGKDYALAAGLLEEMQINPITQLGTTIAMGWLREFPDAIVRENPRLLLWHAWSRLFTGDHLALKDYLEQAEKLLRTAETTAGKEGIADAASSPQHRYMLGEVETLRSYLAFYEDDPDATIHHSQAALDWFGGKYPGMEGHVKSLQGNAYMLQLNYPLAVKAHQAASQTCLQAGEDSMAWLLSEFSARLQYGMGNLQLAEETIQNVIRQVPYTAPNILIHGKAYADLGELYRERNELSKAKGYLDRGIAILEKESCSPFLGDAYISLTSLYMGSQNWPAAWQAIRKAKQLTFSLRHSKLALQVDAYEAWLHLIQGNLSPVQVWAEQYAHMLFGAFGFAVEFPQYILVRARLAQYRRRQVGEDALAKCLILLSRLLNAAEETDRLRSVATVSILQAQIYQELQQSENAMAAFRRALYIAEQSGFVRLFLDEGPPVEKLLRRALAGKVFPGIAAQLLVAFRGAAAASGADWFSYRRQLNQVLVEPLSPREIEILDLIAQRASNKEIAQHCTIEISTVKSHVSSILGKLGARSRRQAVQHAKEIGLLKASA